MHEEKSRFYWYQFSDYTLVWPTNLKKRKSNFFRFFVLLRMFAFRLIFPHPKQLHLL